MMTNDKESELKRISDEIAVCTHCPLHFSRKLTVPGEGPADSSIVFIGEGPGFHENNQGRPFVGSAGNFLEELLGSIGLKRTDVYITNVVKCRPPENRDPEKSELEACSDFLDRQLKIIKPKAIVTLGRHSMGKYFTNAKISQIHGKAVKIKDQLIVAMYHPAAALHQRRLRSVIEEDFSKLPELINKTSGISLDEKLETESPEDNVEQLSLF